MRRVEFCAERSSDRAIANALKVANKAVQSGLCEQIAEQLSEVGSRS